MRRWIPVFVSIFALTMGLPTPESPAVFKIPKPGINIQEDNTPLSQPQKIQVNSPVFPREASQLSGNNEVFPSRFEDGEKIQPSVDSLKAHVPTVKLGGPESRFEDGDNIQPHVDSLFGHLPTKKLSSPLSRFGDGHSIQPSVDSLKSVPAEKLGSPLSRFEDGRNIQPSVDSLFAHLPTEKLGGPESRFEDGDKVQPSVDSLFAHLPTEKLSSPLSRFEEGDKIQPSVDSLFSHLPTKKLSSPSVRALPDTSLSRPQPAIISLPLSASVSVPQPVLPSALVRVVSDPISAPDPPMPSLNVPFTGGMYLRQDQSGQYSFSHWGGPNTRVEMRDLAGVVSGSFAYVNPNGEVQVRKYVAGPQDGFRVAASDLPVSA